MTPRDLMVQMARNNRWANHRLHRAIGELSEDEYRATRTSFFPSLHRTEAGLDGAVRIQRGIGIDDDVRIDTRPNVFLHLFQHQVHHRGQAHAMLAGTRVAPPQLDELHLREDLPRRAAELAELGFD